MERREQAPYLWTLLVPEEKAEEATRVLGEKVSGEPVCLPSHASEPMTSRQWWLLLAVAVAVVVVFLILTKK